MEEVTRVQWKCHDRMFDWRGIRLTCHCVDCVRPNQDSKIEEFKYGEGESSCFILFNFILFILY